MCRCLAARPGAGPAHSGALALQDTRRRARPISPRRAAPPTLAWPPGPVPPSRSRNAASLDGGVAERRVSGVHGACARSGLDGSRRCRRPARTARPGRQHLHAGDRGLVALRDGPPSVFDLVACGGFASTNSQCGPRMSAQTSMNAMPSLKPTPVSLRTIVEKSLAVAPSQAPRGQPPTTRDRSVVTASGASGAATSGI